MMRHTYQYRSASLAPLGKGTCTHHQHVGVTFVELLMVIAIISIVMVAISSVFMQAVSVWRRTSVHIEPQASVMMAFKRMEREMRQAMMVETRSPNPSIWLILYMPKKDPATGLNVVKTNKEETVLNDDGDNIYEPELDEDYVDDNHNGKWDDISPRLQLIRDKTVNYFLGEKKERHPTNPKMWTAKVTSTVSDPDKTLSLFRAEGDNVSGTFTNATVVVDDVVDPTTIEDTSQIDMEIIKRTLFTYSPIDDNGTPDNPTDDFIINPQLITVTLIVEGKDARNNPVYQPLWTEFCPRNVRF